MTTVAELEETSCNCKFAIKEYEAGTRRRRRRADRQRRVEAGLFARRDGQRVSMEGIVARARLLPAGPRALVSAYFELSMPLAELAALQHVTPQQLRRTLMHWRDTLSDPTFVLAARFGGALPAPLGQVARAYWLKGASLRQLAAERRQTMHQVRQLVIEARVALVQAACRHQAAAVAAVGDEEEEE
jgi:hypothetical protein